jgi:DNA polymerase-3 subunit alpha
MVDRLKEVLATHPGVAEVRLRLQASEQVTEWRLPDGLRVAPSPALYGDLKALLGPSAVA